MAKIVIIVIN